MLAPHEAEHHEAALEPATLNSESLEDKKVAGAIQTDFILSAEIMTIILAAIEVPDFWMRAAVLAVAGVGITVAVYGAVALIVKADDFGVFAARNGRTLIGRGLGRGLVVGMPYFMQVLSIVGTAAMTWVGGSIVAHGLYEFGLNGPEVVIETAAHWAEHTFPAIAGFAGWFATAFVDFFFGLILGALLIPVVGYAVTPAWKAIKGMLPKRA
jgi:predicted DNA repair protein MutK